MNFGDMHKMLTGLRAKMNRLGSPSEFAGLMELVDTTEKLLTVVEDVTKLRDNLRLAMTSREDPSRPTNTRDIWEHGAYAGVLKVVEKALSALETA